ncbi:membrane protein [Rhodotorula toruloides]|uniref:Membrane protein n=1 Tax=Rhodotorula toruloides TaxID=5286 RepID=A0A511K980_RHOTO|nr:membrane protein [Rhodotorula toruloides]
MSTALSLVLPGPPPPPPADSSAAAALARPASAASNASSDVTVRAPDAGTGEGGGVKEVSVDDLTRELSDLSDLISTLSTDLTTVLTLRDRSISLGLSCPAPDLSHLASQTTSLGSSLLTLLSATSTTSLRLSRLTALAQLGSLALLPSEAAQLTESLEVCRLEQTALIERVRKAAWEEVDARESGKRRLEERVRMENPGLGEQGVEMAVRTAFVGAQRKVGELNVLSYAGRVAAENPATELAHLLDDALDAQTHSSDSLARQASQHSTATSLTLVDPFADPSSSADLYSKFDDGGDVESQPLNRVHTSASLHGGRGVQVGGEDEGDLKGKEGWVARFRRKWKDWAVRTGLVASVVGLIVGITVYESLAQAAQDHSSSSSSAHPPATASHRF